MLPDFYPLLTIAAMAGADSGIFNWELLDEVATVTFFTLEP